MRKTSGGRFSPSGNMAEYTNVRAVFRRGIRVRIQSLRLHKSFAFATLFICYNHYMSGETRNKTRYTEEQMARLFCVRKSFSKHLSKWEDDLLPDKYDHNCFEYNGQPTKEEFSAALQYQKDKGASFIKLEGDVPLADSFGLESGITLTMVLPEQHAPWKHNEDLTFHKPTIEELEAIEVKHYGPVYGEDFSRRNIRRLFEKYDYHGAYLDGKLVGTGYSFSLDGVTCVDGLIVDDTFRNRYIATSLLAHIRDKHLGDILFLHADDEDTPKEMYLKMGFEIADRLYEYTRTNIND